MLFLVLTIFISGAGYAIAYRLGETNVFLLAAPALAAVITRLIRQRNLRGFGVKLPPIRLLAVAYVLPILITGPMFVIAWAAFGWFGQGESGSVLQSFLIAATAGVLTTSLFAIGEELGWRGYLVPEMAKIARFQTVALASGAIWAIWHWPLILLIPQISGFDQLNPLFAIVSLTLILTGAGVVLAWLTVRSGSLLPAIVMHGAQNAVSQGFLVGHTERTEWSAFLVSEAGALVAVAWVCAGLVVLRLAREA